MLALFGGRSKHFLGCWCLWDGYNFFHFLNFDTPFQLFFFLNSCAFSTWRWYCSSFFGGSKIAFLNGCCFKFSFQCCCFLDSYEKNINSAARYPLLFWANANPLASVSKLCRCSLKYLDTTSGISYCSSSSGSRLMCLLHS